MKNESKCWNLKGDSWTYHNFEPSLCQLWVWDFVDLEGGQPIRIPKFQLQKANCAKTDWNFGGSKCKLMEVMPICKGIGNYLVVAFAVEGNLRWEKKFLRLWIVGTTSVHQMGDPLQIGRVIFLLHFHDKL